MSNFRCEVCNTDILEGPGGHYVTGCPHYPLEKYREVHFGERGFGRTTRMLNEALDELQAGVPNVLILGPTSTFAYGHLLDMFTREASKRGERIRRGRYDTLEVGECGQTAKFDTALRAGELLRSAPGHSVYVDHTVYEEGQMDYNDEEKP